MFKAQPKDDQILQSWGRCIRKGLSRATAQPKITLNEKQLKKRMKKNRVYISLFTKTIAGIKEYITGNYLFLLVDNQGFLLSIIGKEIIQRNNKELGLMTGMSLVEESIGTNAVSMAMELRRPVFFPPNYNYCFFLKNWHCFVIPLTIDDRLIGFLDVSTIKEPMKKELMAISKLVRAQIVLNYRYKSNLSRKDQYDFNDRELTILRLLANGLTEKEVAERILLSYHTVKYYKKKIFNKLSVNCTREAIIKSIKFGILILDDILEDS